MPSSQLVSWLNGKYFRWTKSATTNNKIALFHPNSFINILEGVNMSKNQDVDMEKNFDFLVSHNNFSSFQANN